MGVCAPAAIAIVAVAMAIAIEIERTRERSIKATFLRKRRCASGGYGCSHPREIATSGVEFQIAGAAEQGRAARAIGAYLASGKTRWPITQADADAFVPPLPVGTEPKVSTVMEPATGEVKQ